MLRWTQKLTALTVAFTLMLGALLNLPVAAATACSADVDVNSTMPAWSESYDITIQNTGTTDIQWIEITVPSANFAYIGNSIGGDWQTADQSDGVIAANANIPVGGSFDFPVSAATGVLPAPSANWKIQATSGEAPGVNPATCSGSTIGTAIVGHPPNDTSLVSNVQVLNITTSSATLTWDTDVEVSTVVYYGKTDSYGALTPYDGNFVSSHSVTLTGLTAGTGYHFQVAGQDDQGDYAYSPDNTFLTQSKTSQTYAPSPVPPAGQSVVVNKGLVHDTVPPKVALQTSLSGAYKTVPLFRGTASDDKGILKVEYSTDGGRDWLPVDVLTAVGKSKTSFTFSFTPLITDDGNYAITVRATDVGNNIVATAPQTLVIDRLPPLVGGNVISIGPEVLTPSQDGTLHVIAGLDQKITLSAVGGPVTMSVTASTTHETKKGPKPYQASFGMVQSEDTGLWTGVAGFALPGTYTLTVHSVDGAGNKTTRQLNSVSVASPGQTVDAATQKALSANITVYYLEPESHTWVVWDAAAYDQHNPQKTSTGGTFTALLPPGTYYLRATARGYHTLVSNILTVKQPTPLTATLPLHHMRGLHLMGHYLGLPSWGVQQVALSSDTSTAPRSSLIGKTAPDFTLTDTTGQTVHAADLLGKPSMITIESTWAPTTGAQLAVLSKLQTNRDINVLPVALQENQGRVQAYTAIAGLDLRWAVDPDSGMSAPYQVQSLPSSYFIDRKGTVREVIVGVVSESQALDILGGL